MTDELTISTSIRAQILQAIGDRARELIVLLPTGQDQPATLTWARSSLHPSELPVVNVLPQPETAERGYGTDQITMPVQISIACLLGTNIPVDLGEDLLAIMRRIIPGTDQTLGGLSDDIRYIGGGVDDYPQDQDQALVVNATFEIEYQTVANNPEKGV